MVEQSYQVARGLSQAPAASAKLRMTMQMGLRNATFGAPWPPADEAPEDGAGRS